MGIYLPDLCDFYTHSEAALGYEEISLKDQDIREKHTGWQICLFWVDERP
jgi:hypothetical protein